MLNGAGDDAVRHAGKRPRSIVLRVGEGPSGIPLLEGAAGGMECPELDGYACADAQERGQSAFVESERALVLPDGGGSGEGGGVGCAGLETDFDYVKGLTWGRV